MTNYIDEVKKAAEKLGWVVNIVELEVIGNQFTFSQYSPAGQDFHIEITASDIESLVTELDIYCKNFDCSYETYLWLDNTGHGKNGAPYNMKDLYEDMEACLEMAETLLEELSNIE